MAEVSAGAAVPASESFQSQVEAAETQDLQEAPQVEAQEAETPEVEKVEKVVPLGALHEERQRRKELQAEAAQLRAQFAEMQRQQVEMMRFIQTPQTQQQLPDKVADPLGYQVERTEQVAQKVDQLAQWEQQKWQEQQAANARATFENHVRAQDAAFAQEQPDAPEAINFLKAQKTAEYEAAGLSKAQATQRMLHDELQLCIAATQRGENPAEVAYRMAQAVGYTPAQKKIDMQANGSKASAPNGGGGQGGGKLSLDALLKMDSKDFLKQTSGDNWKKLVGKL